MKLTEKQKEAIETVTFLAWDICSDFEEGTCELCPFYHYCYEMDETPHEFIKNLFKKVLTDGQSSGTI